MNLRRFEGAGRIVLYALWGEGEGEK